MNQMYPGSVSVSQILTDVVNLGVFQLIVKKEKGSPFINVIKKNLESPGKVVELDLDKG
jgi:predicted RNA-binding protein